jgi:hypothetical protein
MQNLAAHVKQLKPALDRFDSQMWTSKGASPTYAAQLKSAHDQLGYLLDVSAKLAQRPERLSLALETYFRLQALEAMVNSVASAARTYQSAEEADSVQSLMRGAVGYREKLRQYLVDLAAAKEEEFAIMDKEAQRCRSSLLTPPQAPHSKKQVRQ